MALRQSSRLLARVAVPASALATAPITPKPTPRKRKAVEPIPDAAPVPKKRTHKAPTIKSEVKVEISKEVVVQVKPAKPKTKKPAVDLSQVSHEKYEPLPVNFLDDAYKHLISVDPRFKSLIEKHPCTIFQKESLEEVIDPFLRLCHMVIGQQVSVAAAKTIIKRFAALFYPDDPEAFPTAGQVLEKSIEELRTAGLSQRKAEYILGIAEQFQSGVLSREALNVGSDAELMEKLIAVRGLGKWSVEMFLCFGLKRPDIFSLGDLGLQKGIGIFLGRDVDKLKTKGGKAKYASEEEMNTVAARFAPYRSVFMWYLWKMIDSDVEF